LVLARAIVGEWKPDPIAIAIAATRKKLDLPKLNGLIVPADPQTRGKK